MIFVVFVLLSRVSSSSSISLPFYENHLFHPTDSRYQMASVTPIYSPDTCICHCYMMSMCSTVTYIGSNRTCVLYFAQLSQGQLQSVAPSVDASVYSFGNRSLSGESEIHVIAPTNTVEGDGALMNIGKIQRTSESSSSRFRRCFPRICHVSLVFLNSSQDIQSHDRTPLSHMEHYCSWWQCSVNDWKQYESILQWGRTGLRVRQQPNQQLHEFRTVLFWFILDFLWYQHWPLPLVECWIIHARGILYRHSLQLPKT